MRTPIDRTLLAAWLRAIPQSRHKPRSLDELPGGAVIGQGLAAMLQVWGAVEFSPSGIRAVSQPAYYFLHSLAAWSETAGPVVPDWSSQIGATAGEGLRHGTTLVHWLEVERQRRDPVAPAIRFTPVAQVLVVQRRDAAQQPPCFLSQWDERAGQYQIIGGRQKQDADWVEPIGDTAVREFEEELSAQISHAAGDFELEPLATFSGETRISPSFGALTAYQFSFFRAAGLRALVLGPHDRWVDRADLLAGRMATGEPVRGDHLPYLEQALGCKIDQLPSSFVA